MPYHINNEGLFLVALEQSWWRASAAYDLQRGLREVLYGVTESQRDGFAVLQDFLDQGVPGKDIFDWDHRFPAGRDDHFYTEMRGLMSRIIEAIQQTLAFRQTTVAKDVSQGTKTPADSNNYSEKNQERQDNAKRFEEVLNLLATLRKTPKDLWWQRSFEQRVNCTWNGDDVFFDPGTGKGKGKKTPEILVSSA